MLAALLVFLFFALTPPKPVQADFIPLTYQLMMAFRPATLLNSTPSVLGITQTSESPPSALAPKTNNAITIALLGDSMIDTLGPSVPNLKKALASFYPTTKFNILNYGYGASTIEEGLARLPHDYTYQGVLYPSLIPQQPDIVIIESYAYNNFGNTQEGLNRQAAALTEMISQIHQRLPNTKVIIAATIAPNSTVFGNGIATLHFSSSERVEKTKTIRLYLENAIKFAASNSLPIINAYDESLSGNDGNKAYISPTDHLHPSLAGNQLFCTLAAKTIFDNNLL